MRAADRDRFTLGAALLRLALAARLKCDPAAVALDRTCPSCGEPHGRPRLLGPRHWEIRAQLEPLSPKAPRAVDLSVAHSGEAVAIAISSAGPVGVDVERLREIDYVRLLADVCHRSERAPDAAAAFLRLWTLKEAVLKAGGEGLATPMRCVAFEGVRVAHAPAHLAAAQCTEFIPAPGHVGAVAVLADTPVRVAFSVVDG